MTASPSPETLRVIEALDTAFPPTNPAVLLAAARDAYLSGLKHRNIVSLLAWTLYVISSNVPDEVSDDQRRAILDLSVADRPKADGYQPVRWSR